MQTKAAEYEQVVTEVLVSKVGGPVDPSADTRIKIMPAIHSKGHSCVEAKTGGHNCLRITPEEWPAIREVIEQAIIACEKYDTQKVRVGQRDERAK